MKYALVIEKSCQKFFEDFAKILQSYLTESVIVNELPSDKCQIIAFGTHNHSPMWQNLPDNTIVVNLEQLYDEAPCLTKYYWSILKNFNVWDYSQGNVEYLAQNGVYAERVVIGWCEHMNNFVETENCQKSQVIDVLFFGWLNERRTKIYQELINHPKLKDKNIVFRNGVWGEEKQNLINTSKIVLNIHYYGERILETLRIFPLLSCGKLVISEKSYHGPENEEWNEGPVLCHLDNMVEQVIYYLENSAERQVRAQKGYNFFRNKTAQVPPIRKEHKCLIGDQIYHHYPGQDAIGSDIFHLPESNLTQSDHKLRQNSDIIAFNNLGYFKTRINGLQTVPSHIGLYVKPLDITFTITTCKRLKHFLTTMDDFLEKCQDHCLIKEWLCVDDCSSEEDREIMQTKYPFFKFIFKNPENRGHGNSMNVITEAVTTKYVLQYEDDWILEDKLWIHDLFSEMTDGVVQVKLLNEHETSIYGKNRGCLNVKRFNPLDLTNLTRIFQKEFLELSQETCYHDLLKVGRYQNGGYWWPGFTLNPSLYRLDMIKNLTKWEQRPEFEYLQGVKVFFKGYKVKVWTNCRCLHLGDDVSAYDLNGFHRA